MTAYSFECSHCGFNQPFEERGYRDCVPIKIEMRGYFCTYDACECFMMFEKPIDEWMLIATERAARRRTP